MLRVAIIEDEKNMAEKLMGYIDRFSERSGETFDVTWFEDAVRFLDPYRPIFDMVLMDIELPRMNGMEAARHLRERDTHIALIFVTNMAQFAVKGYEVDAMDYIVKPVNYSDFELKLRRAVKRCKFFAESIMVAQPGEIKRLLLHEIRYIEVYGHTLVFHTERGIFSGNGSLQDMEEKLKGKGFLRCNKGFLVNQIHVQAIRGNQLILTGNEQLIISRLRKKAFMSELAQSMGDWNII